MDWVEFLKLISTYTIFNTIFTCILESSLMIRSYLTQEKN